MYIKANGNSVMCGAVTCIPLWGNRNIWNIQAGLAVAGTGHLPGGPEVWGPVLDPFGAVLLQVAGFAAVLQYRLPVTKAAVGVVLLNRTPFPHPLGAGRADCQGWFQFPVQPWEHMSNRKVMQNIYMLECKDRSNLCSKDRHNACNLSPENIS